MTTTAATAHYFAVADPDDASVMTYWRRDGDELRRLPAAREVRPGGTARVAWDSPPDLGAVQARAVAGSGAGGDRGGPGGSCAGVRPARRRLLCLRSTAGAGRSTGDLYYQRSLF